MRLSEAGWDNYRHLTRSATFYAVDTEYTSAAKDDPVRSARLISLAVVPVVAGVKGTPLYVEMNPTVAVAAKTTELTGFTTEKVARKRPFAFYARRIVDFFDDPAGVFVAHTGVDLRVLRGELERQDAAGGPVGLADLPLLPIVDTSLLPRLLRLPGLPAARGTVSLSDACALVGVKLDHGKHHDARYDARTTADLLAELLQHAGQSGRADLAELLDDHGRGTTHTPATTGTYTSAPDTHPALPDAHLDLHGQLALSPASDDEDVRAFVEMAAECARLRCEHLRAEAAAAAGAADRLVDPLWGLLAGCGEAGQAATLLGAVAVLLPDGIPSGRVVRWWAGHKGEVAAAAPCGDGRHAACPDCRASGSCPRDVFYTAVARHAALCGQPALTKQTVKYKLFSTPGKKDRRVEQWTRNHPELAGYMAWMVVEWERDNGGARFAAKYMTDAVDLGLHTVEPRFGLLYAEQLLREGRHDEAVALVSGLLTRRTSDEAYDALGLWADRLTQAEVVQARREDDEPAGIRPKMTRPRDRRNPNPYRVRVAE